MKWLNKKKPMSEKNVIDYNDDFMRELSTWSTTLLRSYMDKLKKEQRPDNKEDKEAIQKIQTIIAYRQNNRPKVVVDNDDCVMS